MIQIQRKTQQTWLINPLQVCLIKPFRWVVVRSRSFPLVAFVVDGALSCVTYAGNTFVIEPVVWTAENAKQVMNGGLDNHTDTL